MTNPSIRFEYKLKPTDYTETIFLNTFFRTKYTSIVLIGIAVLIIITSILYLLKILPLPSNVFIALMSYFPLLLFCYFIVAKSVKKFLARDPSLIWPRTANIEGGELSVEKYGLDSAELIYEKYDSRDIRQTIETQSIFLLYVGSDLQTVIWPKRDMKDEDILSLREHLKHVLGEKYDRRHV